MRPGWCLGTPLAEQSLLCAALPASGRIRASSTSWGDRGRSRPAHVDQLSGRCRPLRKSYPAELRRLSSDTYEFRPADRTDDYSAADFVISEALQQTDFDEIRHGVVERRRCKWLLRLLHAFIFGFCSLFDLAPLF